MNIDIIDCCECWRLQCLWSTDNMLHVHVCRETPGHGPHPFWQWTLAPPPTKKNIFSLHFYNLCDNFVKKLVSEITKCRKLQGDIVRVTPGFAPGPQWVLSPTPSLMCSPSWSSGSASDAVLCFSDEDCGITFFSGPTGVVTSPNYHLISRPHSFSCVYRIDVDRTKTVTLDSLSFSLAGWSSDSSKDICRYEWLTVGFQISAISGNLIFIILWIFIMVLTKKWISVHTQSIVVINSKSTRWSY